MQWLECRRLAKRLGSKQVLHGLDLFVERGEVVYYPACPFPLLDEADRAFLMGQELGRAAHKNISYDPGSGRAGGFARRSAEQANRLRRILTRMLDQNEFLSPYGIRALSRYHADHPYVFSTLASTSATDPKPKG